LVFGDSMTPWNYHQQCHPDRVAFCFDDEALTWHQLCEKVDQYQASLRASGMKAGDVLTLVGKNHPQTIFWLLAAHQAGIICAFAMPQSATQLAEKLETLYPTNQKAFLWLAPGVDLYPEDIVNTGQIVEFVSLTSNPSVSVECHYQTDNLATIIFTSGSTGSPKAVAHSHSQHLASARGLLEVFHYQPDDVWLLSLPTYHVSGLAIIYRWLSAGACLKVGSGNLSEDIQGVTHASLVPTQLQRLLESKQSLTLTHVLLGGSHIPHVLGLQAAQLGIETWLGYGMTEAASTVTAKRVDASATTGSVLAERKVKLVDERIFVGGNTLAKGYYYQGILKPLTDEQGWFDTKDLGVWQGEELVIVGRADNLFISGGENIHCEEIETVLNQHPDVNLAMVIPVEDKEFGARPVAVIRSTKEFHKSEGDSWCQDKLEKFKWPIAYFEMPSSLLKGGIKVSRKSMKVWFSEHQSRYTPLNRS